MWRKGQGQDFPARMTFRDYEGKTDGNVHRKHKTEICRHFIKGFCRLGANCGFAHGEKELQDEREQAAAQDRKRNRSPSKHRRSAKLGSFVFHIDELDMPRRPKVEPEPTDREVFVDPMPDEDLLSSCLAAFGDVEEVFYIADQHTGRSSDRGYVKFKDHGAAVRCVKAEFGTWSESERALSGQRSAYSERLIALFVGFRGNDIQKLQDDCGVAHLHLRGEDVGRSDHRPFASRRVHFTAECEDKSIEKVKSVLEKRLAEIHDTIRDHLAQMASRADRKKCERDSCRQESRPNHVRATESTTLAVRPPEEQQAAGQQQFNHHAQGANPPWGAPISPWGTPAYPGAPPSAWTSMHPPMVRIHRDMKHIGSRHILPTVHIHHSKVVRQVLSMAIGEHLRRRAGPTHQQPQESPLKTDLRSAMDTVSTRVPVVAVTVIGAAIQGAAVVAAAAATAAGAAAAAAGAV